MKHEKLCLLILSPFRHVAFWIDAGTQNDIFQYLNVTIARHVSLNIVLRCSCLTDWKIFLKLRSRKIDIIGCCARENYTSLVREINVRGGTFGKVCLRPRFHVKNWLLRRSQACRFGIHTTSEVLWICDLNKNIFSTLASKNIRQVLSHHLEIGKRRQTL